MNGDTQQEIDAKRTEKKLEVVEEATGIRIVNTYDELKVKILARLFKNLSLEQLENVEEVVKKTIFNGEKSYRE